MITREEIRTIVEEELKTFIAESLTRKDFVSMVGLIRGFSPQYRGVLTDFAVAFSKTQNPNFDEGRFRKAIATDEPV